MPPITICPLHDLSLDLLQRICGGYTSPTRYTVTHHDERDSAAFSLQRESLAEPYIKLFTYDEATMANYRSILGQGFSFGAYNGVDCVGVLVGDMNDWNRSLWILEFHVAPDWQRQGIGRQMMAAAE